MAEWRATTDEMGQPIWRDSETGAERPREGEIRTQAAGPGTGAETAIMAPTASGSDGAEGWFVLPNDRAVYRGPGGEVTAERPFVPGGLVNPPDPNLSGAGNFFNQYFNPIPAMQNVGIGVENFVAGVDNWARVPVGDLQRDPGQEGLPTTAAAGPGTILGEIAGASPGLFPEGYEYQPPEYQEEVLGILRDALGSGVTGGEGDLTTPPTFTPDPAIAMRTAQAEARRDRLMPLIEEEIARIRGERERHANRSNMQQFGEWLSRWAATGRPGAAGQTLVDMRERTSRLERQWTMEILRLTEAGYSLEDAVASANANVASAAHQAGERTSIAGYEDAVGDRAARLQGRSADVGLAGTLASVLAGFGAQNEAAEREALSVLSGIPGYEAVGASELGRSMFPNNPEVSGVFASSAAEEAQIASVLSRMGMERGDRRRMEREIRRLWPSATRAQIDRVIQRSMATAGAE